MLLSLLTAEAGSGRRGFRLVGFFLLGRAGAYAGLGLLAWCFGSAVQRWPAWRSLILGAALMGFSVLLLRYGFGSDPVARPGRLPTCVNRRSYRTPGLAVIGGLVTGLNPCAPVLLAFTAAAQSQTILGSLVFFLCFFVGTSVYLVPLPLLGFLGRWNRLRLVARLALGLMGAFYLYAGLLSIIRGYVQMTERT
jgi:sulfite exporter TauE/SafE